MSQLTHTIGSYLVFDLETGTQKGFGRKGNPFLNKVVAAGYKNQGINKALYTDNKDLIVGHIPNSIRVLVGHNIRYDLLYLWGTARLQYMFQQGLRVWDTALAHYLLSGQRDKYPALREIAVNKHGCPEREKVMEKYWDNKRCVVNKEGYIVDESEAYTEQVSHPEEYDYERDLMVLTTEYIRTLKEGYKEVIGLIDTCDIPQELVLHDVSNDVLDTEQVYLQQLKEAEDEGMLKLIELEMDGLLAMTEAEYNGMYINRQELEKNKQQLQEKVNSKVKEFKEFVAESWKTDVEFEVTNPGHLSALLFGGIIKQDVVEPCLDEQGIPILYKSGLRKGEVKTHKVVQETRLNGLGVSLELAKKTARVGVYQTNEDVLVELLPKLAGIGKEVVDRILEIRGLNKELSTYYTGVEELIYPDGYIHPVFNHTASETGRLTAKGPNVQNQIVGESNVHKHFVSRYPGGKIISADYGQIEIVGQAQLSQDRKYMDDVLLGIDFHTKRLAMKERVPYADVIRMVKELKDPEYIEKRKKIKVFSFQRTYGAGAWLISKTTGMTEAEVEELIALEDQEYDGLKKFNDTLEEVVNFTAVPLEAGGKQGWYKSPLGKKYYFKQYPKKNGYEFSVPQIKNYIVQGTCFDVAIIMLGKYWRNNLIHNRDKYLFINMVHDSFMLDCRTEFVEEAKQSLEYLKGIPEMCKEKFGYSWELPVQIETKSGDSWFET